MNLILRVTNKIRSIFGANFCHHGADVRSGTRQTPSPCCTNFSSHGTRQLRPPNGGFIHTKRRQVAARLPAVRNSTAGIQCVTALPGLATSISKPQPMALNTAGGVYQIEVRVCRRFVLSEKSQNNDNWWNRFEFASHHSPKRT
jgi:hypothetical protein